MTRVLAGSCAMGIMAKVPRSGEVKTRLVPPLTHQQASLLSECFLRDVAASIARTVDAHPGRVQGLAVYLPQGGEQVFDRLLPQGFRLLLQRGEDLGERLFHATEDLLSAGFDSVCLVNADSPTLPDSLLREAMLALQAPEERVVLGPATDGGYYLIGLKRARRRLFQGISWSTSEVLAQTVERAREMSLDVHLLPEWYDVDDRQSLRLLCRDLFAANGGGARDGSGTSTRAFLETLLPQLDSPAIE
jgi:uncharacterized protein